MVEDKIHEKTLRKMNMNLMIHYLTKAKEAYERYRKNEGEEEFHITTVSWDNCGGIDDYYSFDNIMTEAIRDLENGIKEEEK